MEYQSSLNDLVPVTPETIAAAKLLDQTHDLWTARMIRWVQHGWSPKSVVCGEEWEKECDWSRPDREDYYDFYMPYAPANSSEYVPSATAEEDGDGVETTDSMIEYCEARKAWEVKMLEAKAKHDRGEDMNEDDKWDYNSWIRHYNIEDAVEYVIPGYNDLDDTIGVETSRITEEVQDETLQDGKQVFLDSDEQDYEDDDVHVKEVDVHQADQEIVRKSDNSLVPDAYQHIGGMSIARLEEDTTKVVDGEAELLGFVDDHVSVCDFTKSASTQQTDIFDIQPIFKAYKHDLYYSGWSESAISLVSSVTTTSKPDDTPWTDSKGTEAHQTPEHQGRNPFTQPIEVPNWPEWDYNSPPHAKCNEIPTQGQLHLDYTYGYRGVHWIMPAGLGIHVREPHGYGYHYDYESAGGSIHPDDALDNLPSDLSYIYRGPVEVQAAEKSDQQKTFETRRALLYINGPTERETISALYDEELCHKDGYWLEKAHPLVTKEMLAENKAATADQQNEARKTLNLLKLVGSNLDMLIPVIQMVLKDTTLCHAIHKELLALDAGFIKQDNTKSFRHHSRIETIPANLNRWAHHDMESAIEDIRLILQDEELILELLDALNGVPSTARKDRILLDPTFDGIKACAACGKSLEELAILYGQDSSTLMATGCRICEDSRYARAKELLDSWYAEPNLIDDEFFESIFCHAKGVKLPEWREEYFKKNFAQVDGVAEVDTW